MTKAAVLRGKTAADGAKAHRVKTPLAWILAERHITSVGDAARRSLFPGRLVLVALRRAEPNVEMNISDASQLLGDRGCALGTERHHDAPDVPVLPVDNFRHPDPSGAGIIVANPVDKPVIVTTVPAA